MVVSLSPLEIIQDYKTTNLFRGRTVCDKFYVRGEDLIMVDNLGIFAVNLKTNYLKNVCFFNEILEMVPHTFLSIDNEIYLVLTNESAILVNTVTGKLSSLD